MLTRQGPASVHSSCLGVTSELPRFAPSGSDAVLGEFLSFGGVAVACQVSGSSVRECTPSFA